MSANIYGEGSTTRAQARRLKRAEMGDILNKEVIMKDEEVLKRFWSKVINPGEWNISKCFIWNFNLDRNGYGRFFIDYKEHKAHRFIYELYNVDFKTVSYHE
jgi:hypothetical protein